MNRTHGVPSFRGEYSFLSNFYPVPHGVYGYATVEHFFVAMKSTDAGYRTRVRACATAKDAKRMDRTVKLREDWEAIKNDVMLTGLRFKFKPDSDLARQLLATGDEVIEEANTWHDTYWGICNGVGHNMLGKMLMTVREELRNA